MTDADEKNPGTIVRAILYDAAGHDREVELASIEVDQLAKEQLLWVDLIGASAQLLPEPLRSALGPDDHVGSLEIFEQFYRLGVALRDQPHSCLRFAVGQTWVLTASEKRPKLFDEFIAADQGETLKGKMTPTALMASLLMRHLDGFREEIASVDVAIDELDDIILQGREKRSPLSSLAALRRRLADLRSVLIGQHRVIHRLVAPDFLAHVAADDQEFLAEVNRLFERLEDDLARARETVIGSFELYASRVAQDTNQLVKILTIATVITGIIGAVAGVFGMNFNTSIPQSGLTFSFHNQWIIAVLNRLPYLMLRRQSLFSGCFDPLG